MAKNVNHPNIPVCKAVTTVGPTGSVAFYGPNVQDNSLQVTVHGAVAVSATVNIEVSNDGIGWLSDSASQFVLSGSTLIASNPASQAYVATAAFTTTIPWSYVRANILAIGAGSAVTVTVAG